jgi:nucleotide-binding universal stress UspA family protein
VTVVPGDPAPAAPYAHVAACLDRSAEAVRGLDLARRLRALGPGRLSIVHVATAPALVGYSRWGVERQVFYRTAQSWLARVGDGVPEAETVLLWGPPADRIIEWARETAPDLLVAASHAGRATRILGSVVKRLATSAPCPALLMPPAVTLPDGAAAGTPFAHIACCVDDSDASRRALAEASRLRALAPGRLSLVHAAPNPLLEVAVPGGFAPSPRDLAVVEETWLRHLAAHTPGAEAVALSGAAEEAVLEWADGAAPDLIVAAAHRGPLERAVVGSFAARMALDAPCPVLLTR